MVGLYSSLTLKLSKSKYTLRLDSGLDGSRNGLAPRAVLPVPPAEPVTPPVPVPLVLAPPPGVAPAAALRSSTGADPSFVGVLEQPTTVSATNAATISLRMEPPA